MVLRVSVAYLISDDEPAPAFDQDAVERLMRESEKMDAAAKDLKRAVEEATKGR